MYFLKTVRYHLILVISYNSKGNIIEITQKYQSKVGNLFILCKQNTKCFLIAFNR